MKTIILASTVMLAGLVFRAQADLWVSAAGNDSNPGTEAAPFLSIQKAVDAAPGEGCTIHVAEGSYYVMAGTTPAQMLEVTKPVRIVAMGARDKTIINAESKRRAVWLNSAGAELSGFTVTKGHHAAFSSWGGVRVSAGVVSNCVIEANHSYLNDGAWVDGGTLTHSVIRNNTTGTNVNGMGVTITSGLLRSCEIYGHSRVPTTGASGGGVYAAGGVVTNCVIHDNSLGFAGYGSTPGNTGGGMRIAGARVTGCTIYNNGVTGAGAGVHISSGTLEKSLLFGNGCTNHHQNAGAALYVTGGTVSNCTVTGNSGLRLAQGVYQTAGTVKDCIVFGNGRYDYFKSGGTSANVFTNNPGFIDGIAGDFRLSSASPCPTAGYRPLSNAATFGCHFTQDTWLFRSNDGGRVTFTATSVNASGGVSYAWDFGDGTSGTGGTVAHDYTPGIYSVRLTATDASGTATTSARACVMALPQKVYVSTAGTGVKPYTSVATATGDIYAALALHPLEIDVFEGTYDVSRCGLLIAEPITISGVDGRDKVIFDAKNASYVRCSFINDAGARIMGAKFIRGTTGDSWASGGMILQAGLVTNCWLYNNSSYRAPAFYQTGGVIADTLISGNHCGGGNTYGEAGEITGGLLVGSTITAPGSIGSSSGKGTLYVNGTGAVVSNCYIHGNNIGGVSKSNYGGGVFMEKGLVVNTVISNNTASITGGGVRMSGGTLRNCLVAGNTINASAGSSGGGVYQTGGAIENCTIVGNTATISGGGLYQTSGTAVNSIFYYNEGDNVTTTGGEVTYSGATPLVPGAGNTAAEPVFLDKDAGDWRFTSLATDYIDKGASLGWMSGALDLAGSGRVNGSAPDIGAIEYYPSAAEPFIANFSSATLTGRSPLVCDLTAAISKFAVQDCTFIWNFGDGTAPQTVVGAATVQHAYTAPGAFTITLTVTPPEGSGAEQISVSREGYVTVIPETCYVSPEGSGTFPYESWEHAARNLPEAVAVGSDTVFVTNGTYTFNGITLSRAIRVVSLNGPLVTILKSNAAQNLMILSHDEAMLDGFTLRDASIVDWNETTGGAGLRITAGTATNCIVRNCQKYSYANTYVGGSGRLFGSQLINNACGANASLGSALYVTGQGLVSGCIVSNNTSLQTTTGDVGGVGLVAAGGIVTNCLFADNRVTRENGRAGVWICGGLVTHCVISNNFAASFYGGALVTSGSLRNALLIGNRCTGSAAGNGVGGLMLAGGVAESLTIVANESSVDGGGVRQTGGTLLNTLVYANTSPLECDIRGGVRSNTFSTVAMTGADCLGGDPQFNDPAAGDWRLAVLSPAKDAGLFQEWMTGAGDLNGLARVQGEAADIGAYEVDASMPMPFSAAFSITGSEKLGNGNTRITFTATTAGGTGSIRYYWTFGDTTPETETMTETETVSHDYAPGAYTVTLRAVDVNSGTEADKVIRTDYAIALPDTCYVAQGEGVSPKYPYVTPASGAPDLKSALDVGCAEVVVCPGTYTVTETIGVGRAVLIRGYYTDPELAIIFAPATPGLRVMNLNHAEAVLSGITLKGGHMTEGYYGGAVLNLTAGTVTNCVLAGGWNYYNSSTLMYGGMIVDSIIRNASAGHSTQAASALTIYDGLVDRCVITNNTTTATSDGSTRGEAVHLSGANAILRNSLIAYNVGHEAAGVRVTSALEFSNCTVVTNRARIKCAGVRCDGRPQICANNIVWGNVAPTTPNIDVPLNFAYSCGADLTAGTGNLAGDPRFMNPAGGNWHLAPDSPCLNAGDLAVMGATRSTARAARDLDGQPRLFGTQIDMGSYEQRVSGTLMLLR